MASVLVAGGAGFIGSHLVKRLLSEGFQVTCVDNFISSEKDNIDAYKDNSSFSFIEADITQPFPQEISQTKWQYIFHLASPASPNIRNKNSYINHPLETLLVNSAGTYRLLELTKQHQSIFLFASTSEIYGNPTISPQSEDYFGNVNPVGVRSVYDEAKRFGEALTMCFFRTYKQDTRIVRIFNTYGPRMQPDDGRVVSNFIVQAIKNNPITIYGDGSQTRSFCYVEDMVDGLIKAMMSKGTSGQVLNLGNPDERKVQELATIVKKMTNSTSEIVYEDLPEDDPMVRKPDISKAKSLLEWEPKVSLDEGLRKTIEYFTAIM